MFDFATTPIDIIMEGETEPRTMAFVKGELVVQLDEAQVKVNRGHDMLMYTDNMVMLFDAAEGTLIQVRQLYNAGSVSFSVGVACYAGKLPPLHTCAEGHRCCLGKT